MNNLIEKYCAEQRTRWAMNTEKNVRHTLLKWSPALDGKPETLWKAIESLAPYTRVWVFTAVGGFWGWHKPGAKNVYKEWKRKHANYFKNAYQPKRVEKTFEEVARELQHHSDPAFKKRALEILYGTLRYSESCQNTGQGHIIGKGGKLRTDYRPTINGPDYDRCYRTFLRTLHKVTGLTPHDLRRLALTRATRNGASPADLCTLAGWSSIKTAYSYLQPLRDEDLKRLVWTSSAPSVSVSEQPVYSASASSSLESSKSQKDFK